DDRWLVQGGKDFLDLCSHRLAQLDVETTQGFVEQKARRIANNGSPDRNPLFFTLAELMRTALQDRGEVESLADPGDALGDLRLAQLFRMQRIGEVLVDREARIQRVELERHGDISLAGRQVVDPPIADHD